MLYVNCCREQKLITKLYLPPEGTPWKGIYARHHGLGDYTDRTQDGAMLHAAAVFPVLQTPCAM